MCAEKMSVLTAVWEAVAVRPVTFDHLSPVSACRCQSHCDACGHHECLASTKVKKNVWFSSCSAQSQIKLSCIFDTEVNFTNFTVA